MGKKVAIIISAIIILSGGAWWFTKATAPDSATDISTSGFIETREVTIASEVAGRHYPGFTLNHKSLYTGLTYGQTPLQSEC